MRKPRIFRFVLDFMQIWRDRWRTETKWQPALLRAGSTISTSALLVQR